MDKTIDRFMEDNNIKNDSLPDRYHSITLKDLILLKILQKNQKIMLLEKSQKQLEKQLKKVKKQKKMLIKL